MSSHITRSFHSSLQECKNVCIPYNFPILLLLRRVIRTCMHSYSTERAWTDSRGTMRFSFTQTIFSFLYCHVRIFSIIASLLMIVGNWCSYAIPNKTRCSTFTPDTTYGARIYHRAVELAQPKWLKARIYTKLLV